MRLTDGDIVVSHKWSTPHKKVTTKIVSWQLRELATFVLNLVLVYRTKTVSNISAKHSTFLSWAFQEIMAG
jgi:hypothetical protein